MAALVEFAKRAGSGQIYVQMETFLDPKTAPGQKEFWYPWPYVEGVTIARRENELAFLVTGMHGKTRSKAGRGAAAAGIAVEIRFQIGQVDRPLLRSPRSGRYLWETVQGSEYGFWANVNPDVPHPRWSQATERVLGGNERVPTLNGTATGSLWPIFMNGLEKGAAVRLRGRHTFLRGDPQKFSLANLIMFCSYVERGINPRR